MENNQAPDEAIADAILKMVAEEGGMKKTELRTEYICNFPQFHKDFDRITEELILTKKLVEVTYYLPDETSRYFLLPANTLINIRGTDAE